MNRISVGEWAIIVLLGIPMLEHLVDVEKMSLPVGLAVNLALTFVCIGIGWRCWRIWNGKI